MYDISFEKRTSTEKYFFFKSTPNIFGEEEQPFLVLLKEIKNFKILF